MYKIKAFKTVLVTLLIQNLIVCSVSSTAQISGNSKYTIAPGAEINTKLNKKVNNDGYSYQRLFDSGRSTLTSSSAESAIDPWNPLPTPTPAPKPFDPKEPGPKPTPSVTPKPPIPPVGCPEVKCGPQHSSQLEITNPGQYGGNADGNY